MAMQKIEINQDFPQPVNELFSYLAEHENLALLFAPAKVTRVRDGKDSRNGEGSARLLKIPLAPVIEETNTRVIDNEHIEYRITNKTPLKNHLGVMEFSAKGAGSHLHYTIVFESRIPLAGPLVRGILGSTIRKGLKKLARG